MANEIKIQKKYVSWAPVLDITTESWEYIVPVETTPISELIHWSNNEQEENNSDEVQDDHAD